MSPCWALPPWQYHQRLYAAHQQGVQSPPPSVQPIAIVCAAGDSFVGIARLDCLETGGFDDSNCITQPEKSISMSVAYTTDKAAMRGHE